MTYELLDDHDRTCRCADCYDGPPSSEWCGHCGKRWDYCECSPIVDQCAACHAPIFEGDAHAEDSDGYRYHAHCLAAVQSDGVLP